MAQASPRSGHREGDLSALFLYLVDAPGLHLGELSVVGAVLLGVFVVLLGTAMATALFHRDRSRQLIALEIFRDLLSLFSGRSR